jgi:uncharacterized YccA/Bax inhibitor family protein
MTNAKTVFGITTYLILILLVLCYSSYAITSTQWVKEDFKLIFECVIIGGFGGVLYCLRGIYLNYCVKKQWSNEWLPWYIIRPIVSLICGGVSFLFLKAGLLVLEAKKGTDASNFGFFALAFIAGMNVDKFISKIEDLAQATWGIEKSRSNNTNNQN